MKIAFLFAGQGAQYVGMGKELYENHPEAKAVFDNIAIDIEVKQLAFEGPKEQLDETQYAQPCILATSMAIANVLHSKGIQPDYVAGLSLGEYAALTYAKVFDLSDAMHIIRQRGMIMANALPSGTGAMAAILNLEGETIEKVCQEVKEIGICEIANYNCPGQVVITGEVKAIELACEKALEKGARRAMRLNVSGAFHSSLLEEASQQLKKVLEQYPIHEPQSKVVYNVSGKEETRAITEILTEQIKSSVYFWQSIEYMIDQGVDTFIEIGPGSALSTFVKKVNKFVKVYNVENEATLQKVMDAIGGQHEQ